MVKAKLIIRYTCPHCGNEYEDREDALECCDEPAKEEVWECGECETEHYNKEAAEKCCMRLE